MDETRRITDPVNVESAELRGVIWLLVEALAKRVLGELNGNRARPNDWPAGQEWNGLVGSSQGVLRALAFDEAEVDRAKGMVLLYGNGMNPYEVDEMKALVRRRGSSSWLPEIEKA